MVLKNNSIPSDHLMVRSRLYRWIDYLSCCNSEVATEIIVHPKFKRQMATSFVTNKAVVTSSTSSISCIYLLRLGTVAECRHALIEGSNNLSCFRTDSVVYKFGLTDDLNRRLKEHARTYDSWTPKGYDNLRLEAFTMVPKDMLYKSESILSTACSLASIRLDHDTYKELVIAPTKSLPTLRKLMIAIGAQSNMYARRTQELIESMNREMCVMRSVLNQNRYLENDTNFVEEKPWDEIPPLFANDMHEQNRAQGVEAK